MPENEKPPAMRVDDYLTLKIAEVLLLLQKN